MLLIAVIFEIFFVVGFALGISLGVAPCVWNLHYFLHLGQAVVKATGTLFTKPEELVLIISKVVFDILDNDLLLRHRLI